MKYNIEFKGFEKNGSSEREVEVRNLIEKKAALLDKRFKRFNAQSTFLRVFVEEVALDAEYEVSLSFDVPGKTLTAKERGRDISSVISAAFTEIERQFDAYRAERRGEHHWKRIARREQLRLRKIGASSNPPHATQGV
jgi:ribosome-associated translation inhibitor RaiA